MVLRRLSLVILGTLAMLAGCTILPSDPLAPPVALSMNDEGMLVANLPRCNREGIENVLIETIPDAKDGKLVWSGKSPRGANTDSIVLDGPEFEITSGAYQEFIGKEDLVVTVDVESRSFTGSWGSDLNPQKDALFIDGEEIVPDELNDESLCE